MEAIRTLAESVETELNQIKHLQIPKLEKRMQEYIIQ